MPFDLPLSVKLAKMQWKVKIRDRERLQDPHVTILHKADVWRVGLRDGQFLDGGSWKDMPTDLREIVEGNWNLLCHEWDERYPQNPVSGTAEDEDA